MPCLVRYYLALPGIALTYPALPYLFLPLLSLALPCLALPIYIYIYILFALGGGQYLWEDVAGQFWMGQDFFGHLLHGAKTFRGKDMNGAKLFSGTD